MKIFTFVMFLLFFLPATAFANRSVYVVFMGNYVTDNKGNWFIIHQEVVIDKYGFYFKNLGEHYGTVQ